MELNLREANLSEVYLGETIFAKIDLSQTHGLESIIHEAPSIIGTGTLNAPKVKSLKYSCAAVDLVIGRLNPPSFTSQG